MQIHQTHFRPSAQQPVPIAALEGGAGDDSRPARGVLVVQPCGNGIQPGLAIVVRESLTGCHLGAGRCGVELVRVPVRPAEPLGKKPAHCGLAGAGHTDDQYGAGRRSAGLVTGGVCRHAGRQPLRAMGAVRTARTWSSANAGIPASNSIITPPKTTGTAAQSAVRSLVMQVLPCHAGGAAVSPISATMPGGASRVGGSRAGRRWARADPARAAGFSRCS